MARYNLFSPQNSIVISPQIEMVLSDSAKKLLKQLTRYHEAIAILERIKVGLDYYIKMIVEPDILKLEAMECGLITLYCSLFTKGLHLPDSLVDEKYKTFHIDIMRLRNRYYCHSDVTGKTPVLNLHMNNDAFYTSIAFQSSLRFLDNINLQWLERTIDSLKSAISNRIIKTETRFNLSLTHEENKKLKELTKLDEQERVKEYIAAQSFKLDNYLSPKTND